jgi:hypothetical protein
MEEKIEDILENNTMYDGVLNKTKVITELLNLFSVSQQRELLIGYSKLILGDNYEAFEEFELKKIDEYLANL